MPSKLNQLGANELIELFREVDSAIFVDFTGVGWEETFALRKLLNERKVNLRVVKSSLAKVALKETGTQFDAESLKGPVAMAYGEDPVAVAKTLVEHRQAFRGTPLKVKGGFVERQPLAATDVKALSELPNRQQLLGLVAGAFAAPISAFIGVQAEIIKKLLYAFNAIKEEKEKKGEAA
jgi:large subunit ribosomal protein L10